MSNDVQIVKMYAQAICQIYVPASTCVNETYIDHQTYALTLCIVIRKLSNIYTCILQLNFYISIYSKIRVV